MNGLKSLCQWAPTDVVSRVMARVQSGLKDDQLMLVTQTEVNIMNTPEGELCDQTIIEKLDPISSSFVIWQTMVQWFILYLAVPKRLLLQQDKT